MSAAAFCSMVGKAFSSGTARTRMRCRSGPSRDTVSTSFCTIFTQPRGRVRS